MVTGISRIATPWPRVARPALLLVGCLATAAAISSIRFSDSNSDVQQSAEGPLAGRFASRISLRSNRRMPPRLFI